MQAFGGNIYGFFNIRINSDILPLACASGCRVDIVLTDDDGHQWTLSEQSRTCERLRGCAALQLIYAWVYRILQCIIILYYIIYKRTHARYIIIIYIYIISIYRIYLFYLYHRLRYMYSVYMYHIYYVLIFIIHIVFYMTYYLYMLYIIKYKLICLLQLLLLLNV